MMSNFTNSSMVTQTFLSPHRTSPRNQPITDILLHHLGSLANPLNVARWHQQPAAQSAYNYITSPNDVFLLVDERDRCWASNNREADNRAVVIGCANSMGAPNWEISLETLNRTLDLIVDVCQRNNIRRLNFTGDTRGNLRFHSMFAATACPGNFLRRQMQFIADTVNARLNGAPVTPPPPPPPTNTYVVQHGDTMSSIAKRHNVTLPALVAANPQITNPNRINVGQRINIPAATSPPPPPTFQQYRVRVTALRGLIIRSGAGNTFRDVGGLTRGSEVTVIGESTGPGARRWGRVMRDNRALGWIALQSAIGVNWVKRI